MEGRPLPFIDTPANPGATVEVVLYPRTAEAIHWLHQHEAELQRGFKGLHASRKHHESWTGHGLRFVVPPMTTESTFDPSVEDYVIVWVPCHSDAGHLDPTWEDLKRVLEDLGAPLASFQKESSAL